MSSIDYELSQAEEYLEASEAERRLVTALLSRTARDYVPDLLAEVMAEDFWNPFLGKVWEAAHALTKSGEPLTRRALFAKAGLGSEARSKVLGLCSDAVEFGMLRQSIDEVVEFARMRRLSQALRRVAQHLTTSASYSEALHFAAQQLAALDEAKPAKDAESFADLVAKWHEHHATPPEQVRTFSTPWYQLDDFLAGGLQPGRTYVIGGRPGEGKTVLALNLAAHVAERGRPAAVFSVEMGDLEVVARVLASGAQANYGQIVRRCIDAENWARLSEYEDSYVNMPLTVIDRSDVTVDYIAAQCRTLKRRPEGLDVVVVDYLQLLRESDSRQSRERQVAQVSRALKVLSRELDVAIIIACQLNRQVTGQDRKPVLSDLRESGAIEQDADVVILLHHEKINGDRTGKVTFCIAKNRTGRMGEVCLTQAFHQARFA